MNQVSTSPSRRRKPVTARGQQTRQNLLEAAEAIFGEKGYENASITEITQRAGVAQGTFYVYFPDKRAAFDELVRELNSRLRHDIATAVAGLTDRLEVERAGFRAFFTFVQNHHNLYRIVRQSEFVDEALIRWHYRRLAEGYVAGLRAAMDAGQVRPMNAEVLAYCLMGIAETIGMRWILWDGENPSDEIFESMFAFIRHGMAAEQPGGA